ncbi:MAG: DUF2299 family protein [Methanotrichaceae archaeon]
MVVGKTEEAKKVVREWMEIRGFLRNEISDEHSHFRYEGESDSGIKFSIIQPKELERSLVVLSRLDIHPQHIKLLQSMSPGERSEFLWNLKRDIVFAPPVFQIYPLEDPDNPTTIEFIKEISFDELTEGRLMEAMDYVHRCVLWVIWTLNKVLGRVEEE